MLEMKAPQIITVTCRTADDTARAGEDYTPTEQLLTFQPGETSHACEIPLIDDERSEQEEEFLVTLSSTPRALLIIERATVVIRDNDRPHAIDIQPVGLVLPATGISTATLRATVQNQQQKPLANQTVAFSNSGGGYIEPETAMTDEQGVAHATLIAASMPGRATVRATTGGSSAQEPAVYDEEAVTFDWVSSVYLASVVQGYPPFPVYVNATASPSSVAVDHEDIPVNIDVQLAWKGLFLGTAAEETATFVLNTTLGVFENGEQQMVYENMTTDGKGRVQFKLIPQQQTGTAVVTIQVEGARVKGQGQVEVIFAGPTASIDLQTASTGTSANGAVRVAAKVTDADGNPVPRQPVNFTRPSLGSVTHPTTTTADDGLGYTMLYCEGERGVATLEALAASDIQDTISIECAMPHHILLTPAQQQFEARLGNTAPVTAVVQDAEGGMALAGKTVNFATDHGILSRNAAQTDAQSTAGVVLGNPELRTYTATVVANVDTITASTQVQFVPVPWYRVTEAGGLAHRRGLPAVNTAYRITSQQKEGGALSGGDEYYELVLQETATITVAVRDMPQQADYDLELLAASDITNPLDTSAQSGNADEQIVYTLNKGLYYIRVIRPQPGDYTLVVLREP
jgi:hypothetical protein